MRGLEESSGSEKEPANILIEYAKEHFLISIPFKYNEYILLVPEHKWRKAKKVWACTDTQNNREAIRVLMKTVTGHISPEAHKALDVEYKAPDYKGTPYPSERLSLSMTPLAHQDRAFSRAWDVNAFALFHKPGLGKTFTAIGLGQLWELDLHVIIPPCSLLDNWVEQINNIDTSVNLLWTTNDLKKGKCNYRIADRSYLVVGIESLQNGNAFACLVEAVKNWHANGLKVGLTIDESTSIKTYNSVRTDRMIELADDLADTKLILNGTSITKGYEDHFGQYRFLGRDVIGYDSFWAFRNQYCMMGGHVVEYAPGKSRATQILGYKNTKELLDRLSPHTDIEDKRGLAPDKLPPSVSVVDLSKQQAKVYNEVKEGSVALNSGEDMNINEVLVEYTRLQQVCGGFFPDDLDSATVSPVPGSNPALTELVRLAELYDVDEPLVVFCKYQAEVVLISNALAKSRDRVVGQYCGANENADKDMRDFKAGTLRTIVGTFSKMAKGHDLYMCNTTLYYSFPFSYDQFEQSADRTNRLSSTKDARYHVVMRRNTIDEQIWATLKKRQDLSDYINVQMTNRQTKGQ